MDMLLMVDFISAPPVFIKRASDINVDDFYHYYRMLPFKVNKSALADLHTVLEVVIKKTKLNNSSFHAELIRTDDDNWKVVEIAARSGGYRDWMYNQAYNIPHIENVFNISLDKKPKIPKKVLQHVCIFEIFPEKKGRIKSLQGIKKIKELSSFVDIEFNKNKGDISGLAKQGYRSTLKIFLANETKSKLIADRKWVIDNVRVEV